MTFASLGFPAIVALLCLAVSAAIASRDPWYREHLTRHGHRFEAIDGLRGFLAVGVLCAHTMTTRGFYTTGIWGTTSRVHAAMGESAVTLFFMVTGFLFWRHVIRSAGAFDTRAFYKARIRRLLPMYAVSVAFALFVIAALSGFKVRVDLFTLIHQLREWVSFGFIPTGELNGVKDAHIVNAVYWTLAWEWSFYLALPLLALFARGWGFALLVSVAILFGTQAPVSLAFVAGVLAAEASERGWLQASLSRNWMAPVPIAAIGVALTFETAYHPVSVALLFVAFLFFAAGNTLGGLLTTRAAKLLGAVSYSFYLIHCIVLFVAFRLVEGTIGVASLSPERHWMVAALAATAATALSAITYRRVEYPFIASRAPRAVAAFEPIAAAPAARLP
ncbi:MAG TPA: acyltransferase [Usitatibacter sp.]|jgi:peptidoglycan/LPS O-acetylase OafA/YrhL|nr:acyltransferase [Usitatibacter sp.]